MNSDVAMDHRQFRTLAAPGRRARRWRVFVAAFALGLAACQSERDPPGPGDDEAWWEVENITPSEIVELNLAASPAGDHWGLNQLEDITLPPTEEFRLREVPCPDTYDMRAIGDEGGLAYKYEVEFDCDSVVDWEVVELE